MRLSTPTLYHTQNSNSRDLGIPHVIMEHTTMNEKLGILSEISPTPNDYPTLNVWCIGNGGHKYAQDATGFPETTRLSHQYIDPFLYSMIPFAARPHSNDFTEDERKKYFLRRSEKLLDGGNYWVYYAKEIDPITSGSVTKVVNTTEQDFIPTESLLNLSPVVLSSTEINELSATKISTYVPVTITLDSSEIEEVLNACRLKYGNENRAVISEIALCQSHRFQIEIDVYGNQTATMTEAIGVQTAHHLKTTSDLTEQRSLFHLKINVGNSEPLIDII